MARTAKTGSTQATARISKAYAAPSARSLVLLWVASIAFFAVMLSYLQLSAIQLVPAAVIASMGLFSLAMLDVSKAGHEDAPFSHATQTVVSGAMFATLAALSLSLASNPAIAAILFAGLVASETVVAVLAGIFIARGTPARQTGIEAAIALNIRNKYAGLAGSIF